MIAASAFFVAVEFALIAARRSRLEDACAQIQDAGRRTGHLRLLVGCNDVVEGVVHVRDSVTAAPGSSAADLARPVLTLDSSVPVYEALATMRERRCHLCTITGGDSVVGVITLTDVLERLLLSGGSKQW